MVVIKNEKVAPFDVDSTLVMHQDPESIYSSEKVFVKDSVSGGTIVVRINRPMVRLLKEEHARGAFVIVWSRGGYQWAADVIKALGLSKCVNLVITKPGSYYDDLEVQAWLKDRIYIGPNEIYKQLTETKEL